MAVAQLLAEIGKALRRNRPLVPENIGYRIVVADAQRRFAQIWLRTIGCRHDLKNGGCTMCNYWASRHVSTAQITRSMELAIKDLTFEPKTLVLSASGSFLDSWEIPLDARARILRILRNHWPSTHVILETHADTVTLENLSLCSQILGNQWTIEMGLESANPAILRYCVNKNLSPNCFSQAIKHIQQHGGISSIANLILGIPFLTYDEIIEDAMTTIKWAFDQGIDECVLFPMNLKPYTLVHWLYQHSLYQQPSLWLLVDILAKLPVSLLPRINFAWHRIDRGSLSEWDEDIIPPGTCNKCYTRVVNGLDSYLASNNREEIIQALHAMTCTCRREQEFQPFKGKSLQERLLASYKLSAVEILGKHYWEQHEEGIQKELNLAI